MTLPGDGSDSWKADRPLLVVEDLVVRFGKVKAVDGVSFVVQQGQTFALVGESGSGKSTIGRAIMQINRPTGGLVSFEGTDLTRVGRSELRRARRRLQMIFQDPRGSLDPRMKVADILAEPMIIHATHRARERQDRVSHLLEIVGLRSDIADRYPHQISGGQAQRVAIARALALEPALIVADEPISSLDVSVQAQVVNLLSDLRKRLNLSLVFIAHDLAIVRHIADRVAVMYLGRIMEIGDKRDIYSSPLHPYTLSLLSAVPSPNPERERHRSRIILQGEIPTPDNPPAGCVLSTRCPLRAKLGYPRNCVDVRPELEEASPGHLVACHYTPGPNSPSAG